MARSTNKNKAERKRLWREANGYTYNGNRLVQELPFEQIETVYHEHRRLRVFAQKGYTCTICGVAVGTKFLETESRTGNIHRDLYTDDLVLMTIDHIIPKIRGGSDDMDNLRPACGPCNWEKGQTTDVEGLTIIPEQRVKSPKPRKV